MRFPVAKSSRQDRQPKLSNGYQAASLHACREGEGNLTQHEDDHGIQTIGTDISLIMMTSGPAYAHQIKTYSGQPLCSDQDGLLALIIAGIHGDTHALVRLRLSTAN